MAHESNGAAEAEVQPTGPGIRATGNPIVDGISRLLLYLERLLAPQPAPGSKSPEAMTDEELREAAFRIAIALVDGLGVIVQANADGRGADDPSWHRPWPTTVEMFIRSMFMTSLDAFGTAAVGLGINASVASTGNIRTVAECHALMRWVLDGRDEDEQRGRVLAMTTAGIKQARRALAHWDQGAGKTRDQAMIAYVRQALDATQATLGVLEERHGHSIAKRPNNSTLFDLYLPGGYFMFAMLSNVGAHPGPSPFFFYGESEATAVNWDYKSLHVERAYWISQACKIQLDNCRLAAPVTRWVDYEHLLVRVADALGPLATEAATRFMDRRDPKRIWV